MSSYSFCSSLRGHHIVDLSVFWQPGSITNVLNCHDCHVFESSKYLLLLSNSVKALAVSQSPDSTNLIQHGCT